MSGINTTDKSQEKRKEMLEAAGRWDTNGALDELEHSTSLDVEFQDAVENEPVPVPECDSDSMDVGAEDLFEKTLEDRSPNLEEELIDPNLIESEGAQFMSTDGLEAGLNHSVKPQLNTSSGVIDLSQMISQFTTPGDTEIINELCFVYIGESGDPDAMSRVQDALNKACSIYPMMSDRGPIMPYIVWHPPANPRQRLSLSPAKPPTKKRRMIPESQRCEQRTDCTVQVEEPPAPELGEIRIKESLRQGIQLKSKKTGLGPFTITDQTPWFTHADLKEIYPDTSMYPDDPKYMIMDILSKRKQLNKFKLNYDVYNPIILGNNK